MRFIFNESRESKRIMHRLNRMMPKSISEELFKMKNVFLCGGAILSMIRGEKPNDFDFFCSDQKTLEDLIGLLKKSAKFKLETDNAYSFEIEGVKFQAIKKFYCDGVQNTIEKFDFRAVMLGCDMQNLRECDGFWMEENSLMDIAKSLLVVMPKPRHPFNVSFRIAKYLKKGWNIKGQSFVRLILQQLIRAKSVKTLADVRDEIIGLDTVILANFFKKFDRFPPEQPMETLELNEFINEVDDYFERFIFGKIEDDQLTEGGE